MPPQDKKWDSSAERDLCISIIQASQDEGRVRYNWPRVHTIMTELGYSFTKDAMSQHLTKTIMKDFKARNGLVTTPKKATSASKTTTPASKKRSRATAKATEIVNDDEVDDEMEDATPSKKPKTDPDAQVKKEEEREQSAPIADNEVDFRRWLNDDITAQVLGDESLPV